MISRSWRTRSESSGLVRPRLTQRPAGWAWGKHHLRSRTLTLEEVHAGTPSSIGTVFLSEIGDKTQLLSVVLASRFRKPWHIIIGILIATAANHLLAGLVGA